MRNFFLAFLLALLVVLSSVRIRQSVLGIGGTPVPLPPPNAAAVVTMGIGGTPVPLPPPK